MLQALKVDTPAPRPALNRERETAPDLQDQAFSGYLATAASFSVLPGPAPAAPPAPIASALSKAIAAQPAAPIRRSPAERPVLPTMLLLLAIALILVHLDSRRTEGRT